MIIATKLSHATVLYNGMEQFSWSKDSLWHAVDSSLQSAIPAKISLHTDDHLFSTPQQLSALARTCVGHEAQIKTPSFVTSPAKIFQSLLHEWRLLEIEYRQILVRCRARSPAKTNKRQPKSCDLQVESETSTLRAFSGICDSVDIQ